MGGGHIMASRVPSKTGEVCPVHVSPLFSRIFFRNGSHIRGGIPKKYTNGSHPGGHCLLCQKCKKNPCICMNCLTPRKGLSRVRPSVNESGPLREGSELSNLNPYAWASVLRQVLLVPVLHSSSPKPSRRGFSFPVHPKLVGKTTGLGASTGTGRLSVEEPDGAAKIAPWDTKGCRVTRLRGTMRVKAAWPSARSAHQRTNLENEPQSVPLEEVQDQLQILNSKTLVSEIAWRIWRPVSDVGRKSGSRKPVLGSGRLLISLAPATLQRALCCENLSHRSQENSGASPCRQSPGSISLKVHASAKHRLGWFAGILSRKAILGYPECRGCFTWNKIRGDCSGRGLRLTKWMPSFGYCFVLIRSSRWFSAATELGCTSCAIDWLKTFKAPSLGSITTGKVARSFFSPCVC